MLFLVDRNKNMLQFSNASVLATFGVSIAVLIAFYLLRSFGLFILARKNGYKNAFLAFIPFAWIYLAGYMVKDEGFFGMKMKSFALVILIVFTLSELSTIVYNFLVYFPLLGYYFSGLDGTAKIYFLLYPSNEVVSSIKSAGCVQYPLIGSLFCYSNFQYPYSIGVEKFLPALRIISGITDIVKIVFLVSLFFNLFRKFWPEHFILGAIFSIIGFFPIFIFAVRNRTAVDYRQFIYEKYGVYTDGVKPNAENGNGASEEPFSDFADEEKKEGVNDADKKDEDPFSEFPDDKEQK